MRFDHILIRVDNLNETVYKFQKMGFNVYYGNAKKNCHHAMIYFADGSFIEFIDQSKFPSLLRFLARKGILNLFGTFFKRIGFYAISKKNFLDYALHSSHIEQLYEQVKTKTTTSKLMKLKRTNHKKEKIRWELFAFGDMELPFVMSDYIPQKYPEENAAHHPNGSNGIKQVQIATKFTNKLAKKFENLFQLNTTTSNIVTLENTQIVLKESDSFEIQSITLSGTKTDIQYDLSHYKIML